MRPILALNCLLQIEQERSAEESSIGAMIDHISSYSTRYKGVIHIILGGFAIKLN